MNNLLKFIVFVVICQISATEGSDYRVKRSEPLRVVSLKVVPYFMEKSKDKYEGFIVDLMMALSNRTGQTYSMYPVTDGAYGQLKDNKWNGLVGDVVQGKAQIAAAPLTVNKDRKSAVTFTEPFSSVDLVLVVRKPTDGSDLTVRNAKDLIDQSAIRLITIRDGSTYQYFASSTDPVFKKIGENIQRKELVSTLDDGIKKVREGNYGLLMESQAADHLVNMKPCDLAVVKISTDNHKYALAVAKDNEQLGRTLSDAIKQMKKDKSLEALEAKWWVRQCPAAASTVKAFTITVLLLFISFM